MSKTLIAVCLVAALFVAAHAQSFDCGGVQELKKNSNCCQMCNCMAAKDANIAKIKGQCVEQCNKCTGACGASGPLPSACAGVNALKSVVEQCLSEYQTARKQGDKALQEAMKKYPSTC